MLRKPAILIAVFVLILPASCAHQKQVQCLNTSPHFETLRQCVIELAQVNNLDCTKIFLCVFPNDTPNAWVDERPCIHVTTGLLERIPSETMLKCVIAHELSHYTLGHIRKSQVTSRSVTAGFLILNLIIPGSGWLNHLVNPTVVRTYSRQHELEADQNAVLMMARAGIRDAKKHFIELLTWLQSESGDRKTWLWSTHPSAKDRIEAVNELPKFSY